MVSAGLDTVPGTLIMGLAYLSTPEGQAVQAKALAAIQEAYPDGEAWEKCLVEEKIPYVRRTQTNGQYATTNAFRLPLW